MQIWFWLWTKSILLQKSLFIKFNYNKWTFSSSENAVKTSFGYECQEKHYIDYCIYRKFDTTTHNLTESKTFILDIFRVCGKITFYSQTLPNDKGTYYRIEKVEKNYIGIVDNG